MQVLVPKAVAGARRTCQDSSQRISDMGIGADAGVVYGDIYLRLDLPDKE